MEIIAQNKRYLPHEMSTKINSVKLYRQTHDISFVCRRYHISKASLMRWNKRYDGTKESLENKSHRPHSQHPQCAHRAGAELDSKLPSTQSKHQRLRTIWQAAAGKGIQPPSWLTVSCIYPAWLSKKGGINEKEIKASGALPYADRTRREVADGCEICSYSLLYRDRW